jgi:hydroxymethylpyrimidine pyrophosphatase-like HAD family hydrolase
MKISIDMDGTLWSHMAFFRGFMRAMQSQGHEVGILTGHVAAAKEHDVQLMVARGFPVPNFYIGKVGDEVNYNGAISKSKAILSNQIDMHFDDYDFNNLETTKLFREHLGAQIYRLARVYHRDPVNVHYE